ncbi:hypothetical protein CSX04_05259 [Burkholderia cepacia]|nr:hypothetical protein CSX04_05259 [Burkholderia cepacia]
MTESPHAANETIAGRPALTCEHKETLGDAVVHQAVVATAGDTKTCALIYTAREENYARICRSSIAFAIRCVVRSVAIARGG